jgi:hypothetical protein
MVPLCQPSSSLSSYHMGQNANSTLWVFPLRIQIPTFTTARQAEARMVKNHARRHKPQHNINIEYNKFW